MDSLNTSKCGRPSPGRVIFSKRGLTTEETFPKGKASSSCENIQTMTKVFIFTRWRKSEEVHLSDLERSIRQHKMLASGTSRLPWVVLGTRRQAGKPFVWPCSCFPISSRRLLFRQWTNGLTHVEFGNEDFESPVRLQCYFIWTRAFSLNQIKTCWISTLVFFSSLGQLLGFSLVYFSKFSFGEIALWTISEIWLLLVLLEAAALADTSVSWFPLASRDLSLECLESS